MLTKSLERIGAASFFALRVIADAFRAPFEVSYILQELADQGWRSLPLIVSSGMALGFVMTLHTRSELIKFGAGAWIPTLQSLSFFVEIGPLVAALLVAGRVGAGMGASLAEMRATEQIDAIEALSVDSFKLLVVPRVAACVLALPLLTTFMDFCGVLSGFLSEHFLSHLSFQLYITRAFSDVGWSNFIPPTLKTAVFGFIIGTVSCFFGYRTDGGAEGVRRAATNSVVMSSHRRTPQRSNELRTDLRAQHQPANETERILVNELAEKFWRIRRAGLFEVNAPEDRAKLKALAAVQRRMSSAERGFHRSLATLRQLRKERQKDGFVSQDSPAASATPARSAERSERVRNLDGSVPQNTDHDQRKPTSPFERARCH